MDDAQLYSRLWIDRLNRFRESFQAIHTGYQDIPEPPVLQLGQDTQPELRPFILCQPEPLQLFLPLEVDAQDDMD